MTADRVRFDILGSLECWYGARRVPLGGPRQARMLVTLLLEPGRVVPVRRLIEAAWEDAPPATAVHQVRKTVADLRRRLPGGAELIRTDGPGYRAVVEEGQLDLLMFRSRLRRAAREDAAGRPERAVAALRSALDLWRDTVMADSGSAVIRGASTVLEEQRLAAAEQVLVLRAGLGEAAEVIGELRRLIADHPLRETLRAHLMRALCQCGRQAEAVAEYARVRELLGRELGVDPGLELSSVHEAILRRTPVGAPVRPRSAARYRSGTGTVSRRPTVAGVQSE